MVCTLSRQVGTSDRRDYGQLELGEERLADVDGRGPVHPAP
jgi:hypothetical protein